MRQKGENSPIFGGRASLKLFKSVSSMWRYKCTVSYSRMEAKDRLKADEVTWQQFQMDTAGRYNSTIAKHYIKNITFVHWEIWSYQETKWKNENRICWDCCVDSVSFSLFRYIGGKIFLVFNIMHQRTSQEFIVASIQPTHKFISPQTNYELYQLLAKPSQCFNFCFIVDDLLASLSPQS